MRKRKAAVIGCGSIAPRHLDAIEALENVELVGVCDIREERVRETANRYHTRAYTDYKKLFEIERPDAVHLCLPHDLHTVVARDAFAAGIHVLSEKPAGILYEDVLQTVEMAEALDLRYGVIFQNRFNVPAQLTRARIHDGRLGRVLAARTVLTWSRSPEYYSGTDWKGTWSREGGGVIINQSIHVLDLANWFIDSDIADVQVSLHNRLHPGIAVEDTAEGLVQYKNGARLVFYATNNYLCDETVEIRLQCEHGSAVMTYDEISIRYQDGTTERAQNSRETFSYSGGKGCWGNQHIVQIRQFYRAVAGEEPLALTARDALKTQDLICRIYREPYAVMTDRLRGTEGSAV